MKKSLRTRVMTIAASSIFACLALPAIASADVCSKIDFTFASNVYDQVVLYTQNRDIYASDAACILRHIPFASTQEEVGVYLTKHLIDPDNINKMLDEVTYESTKESITKAALENSASRHHPPHPHPHPSYDHYRPLPPPPPPAPRIHVVENVNNKIDYTFASKIMDQVKLYVGDSYIYSSDAAAIIRKTDFAAYQSEVGAYLCPKVIDRNNID